MHLLKDCKVPNANNVEYEREKSRDIVEKQEKEEQTENEVDLIPSEYKRALEEA